MPTLAHVSIFKIDFLASCIDLTVLVCNAQLFTMRLKENIMKIDKMFFILLLNSFQAKSQA
tara:strand:+ start:1179 stop:1361 length:183 start_codon:yes stop_codon:yes gene_type:complete